VQVHQLLVVSVLSGGAGADTRLQLGLVRQHDAGDPVKQWTRHASAACQGTVLPRPTTVDFTHFSLTQRRLSE